MVALNWNQPGQKFYEAGVDRGVLYPLMGLPVVWNGLVSVNEVKVGGEQKPVYMDGVKIFDIIQNEDFQADVTAFSSPVSFQPLDGIVSIAPGLFATQQPRSTFNFCYRTRIGNDLKREEFGYKIHFVYNVTASPTTRENQSLSDSTNVNPLTWSFHTVPPKSLIYKPTSHLVVDVSALTPTRKTNLENYIYGTSTNNPTFPTQATLIALITGF